MSPSPFDGYSTDPKPLGSYAVLTTVFNAGFGALLYAVQSRRAAADRVALADLAIAAVATQKLSRLLAKDRVTSFLRAPFTTYEKDGGPSEVEEKPRGEGIQLAIGELVVCPYCLAQWVAAGFVAGYLLAPRPTRAAASVFATLAAADFLQLAYKSAEEHA